MRPSLQASAALLAAIALAPPAHARTATEIVLYAFNGARNGAAPSATLLPVSSYVYGTTASGGKFGGGTMFLVTRRLPGKGRVLHDFGRGKDGAGSVARISFYEGSQGQQGVCGTTSAGGAHGLGALFSYANHVQLLYSFKGGADGADPRGALIGLPEGGYYGTTSAGGAHNKGTIFEYSGTSETVLHSFGCRTDGAVPTAGLNGVGNGVYYGTTEYGGANTTASGGAGDGTVFQLDAAGHESVLYAFQGGADGAHPTGDLFLLDDGNGELNLYGTTTDGGPTGNGTVFGLTASGAERIVHAFTGPDGSHPVGNLIRSGRYLYGVTQTGGAYNAGTVFSIAPGGPEKVVYSFTGGADGAQPAAGLAAAHGILYGTTASGGPNNDGVVFALYVK